MYVLFFLWPRACFPDLMISKSNKIFCSTSRWHPLLEEKNQYYKLDSELNSMESKELSFGKLYLKALYVILKLFLSFKWNIKFQIKKRELKTEIKSEFLLSFVLFYWSLSIWLTFEVFLMLCVAVHQSFHGNLQWIKIKLFISAPQTNDCL